MTDWKLNDYALDTQGELWRARRFAHADHPAGPGLLWTRTGSVILISTRELEEELGPLAAVTLTARPADTDPYAVRLWLAVRRSDGNADTLYVKTIRTAHTPPTVSDTPCVALWDGDDDAGIRDGRWWTDDAYTDADGLYNLHLVPLWPDPDQEALTTAGSLRDIGFPWHRAGGPDHHTLLTGAGWTEWDGRP